MLLDVFDDIWKGSNRFERNSRKGIEGSRMSEPALREAEDHHRSSAFPVGNDFAGVRDKRLGLVDVQNV